MTDKYFEKDDKEFRSAEERDFYNDLISAVERIKKETDVVKPRYVLICPIHNDDINYCWKCCDNGIRSVCLHYTEMLSQNRNIP